MLDYLDLHGNSLTGSIPDTLQDLVNLTHLDLSNNDLSGQANPLRWPGQKLSQLEVLSLSNNRLDLFRQQDDENGHASDPLGNETRLRILGIAGNPPQGDSAGFTATIPDGIRYLTTLTELTMHGSDLGGTLPAWIFRDLPDLELLDVSYNRLEGNLDEIFREDPGNDNDNNNEPSQSSLKALLLHNNHLTGTLPESIARIPDLGELGCFRNG